MTSTRRDPAVAVAAPTLALSVQYASTGTTPSRARVRRWVRAALAHVDEPAAHYALTVRFVDEDEGRSLNRTFRGRDYATNVLTFPYPDDAVCAADIVVSMPVVEREAREQAKDAIDHCAHLVVHGVLHAAGYDHERRRDADAMEAIERVVLRRFRITDPYVAIDDRG
jgi:probable rRNA maturation factor